MNWFSLLTASEQLRLIKHNEILTKSKNNNNNKNADDEGGNNNDDDDDNKNKNKNNNLLLPCTPKDSKLTVYTHCFCRIALRSLDAWCRTAVGDENYRGEE